jgi:methylenetetrahydrofolate reductase (NADPH)
MIKDISFEFFPPRTEKMEQKLKQNIGTLMRLSPRFVSVTYGAGGTTRYKTHQIVSKLINETKLNVAAHLTCVNASLNEIDEVIENYVAIGVKHIVALRGDMKDLDQFIPHPQGFTNSIELVKHIKDKGGIKVSISGYPEPHPESQGVATDINFIKSKIDAGADQIITQFSFETQNYIKYRDTLVSQGINIPIIPGIMLIKSFNGIKNMSRKIGIKVPNWVDKIIEKESEETQKIIAEDFAITQSEELEKNGFEQLHFYTLNESEIMVKIAKHLGFHTKNNTE